jgi:hypothetical protein
MDQGSLTLAIEGILATLTAIAAGALVFTRRSTDGEEDITYDVARDHTSRLESLERYRDL